MAKVLVVDDSLSVRKVVERTLEAKGMQVLSAASGSEALRRIEQDEPDLVICDVMIPDRDGYQICQFVKSHPRLGKIPVILISGAVNRSALERAAPFQPNDVMLKPFSSDDLVRKIAELLPVPVGAASGSPAPPGQAPAAPAPPPAPAPPDPAAATPAAVPAGGAAPHAMGLKASLDQFAAMPGVRLVVVVDREGFLIESAGENGGEGEMTAALSSCLRGICEGMGPELGQGALQGMILEYERGMVLLQGVGPRAMLAALLHDPTVLGKVRYYVKKGLPELVRAL